MNTTSISGWNPPKSRPLYNNVIETAFSGEGTTEPVTVAEMKRQLQLAQDFTDDDVLLQEIGTGVRETFEQILGVSIITRQVKAWLKNEMGGIELPYGPTSDIISVSDDNGVLTTSDYEIFLGSGSPAQFKYLKTTFDLVAVEYKAGPYLPAGLKRALLKEIAWQYQHRGDEDKDSSGIHAREALKYQRPWLQ